MKNKTKQNQKNKRKFNNYTQKEEGVTLVALIVTIVVMVIIAAVSIVAVYNSRIVEHAINGTQGYATEGINENKVLEGTESLIDSTVQKIDDILGENIKLSITLKEIKWTNLGNMVLNLENVQEYIAQGYIVQYQKNSTEEGKWEEYTINSNIEINGGDEVHTRLYKNGETIDTGTINAIKISLSKEEIELGVGKEETIIANIEPEAVKEKLIWKSSNPEIATVTQEGKITGLKVGEAIITVQTEDSRISKECKVYVSERLYLIKNGKDCTEVTGGWVGCPYYGRATGTLTFASNDEGYANFVGTDAATVYRKAMVNDIDWSKYKTMNMTVTAYNKLPLYDSSGCVAVALINSLDSWTQQDNKLICYGYKSPEMNEQVLVSMDLPDNYVAQSYLAIYIHRCYSYVYDVYLDV